MKKKRKRRGRGIDGKRSYDLCPSCYSYNCDPLSMSQKFVEKIEKRVKNSVCPACGASPCVCKSSLNIL